MSTISASLVNFTNHRSATFTQRKVTDMVVSITKFFFVFLVLVSSRQFLFYGIYDSVHRCCCCFSVARTTRLWMARTTAETIAMRTMSCSASPRNSCLPHASLTTLTELRPTGRTVCTCTKCHAKPSTLYGLCFTYEKDGGGGGGGL